jgi:hypothetical protein
MNLTPLTNGLEKVLGQSRALTVRANSPQILLGVGIVGVVSSTVLACRATLKSKDVFATHRENIEAVHTAVARVESGERSVEEYSDQDRKKDLTITYSKTGWSLLRLYGPPVIIGSASIACLISGQGILIKRNVALAAAYKAVDEGFRQYRQRVIDEYGSEKDYMLKHGLRADTIIDQQTDEKGKTKNVKKAVVVSDDPSKIGVYARWFMPGSTIEWKDQPEYNYVWLKGQQQMANDYLHAHGHIFLNDVYRMLGFEQTSAGSVVGWVAKGDGDGYVDFGMYDAENAAFIHGENDAILLDFNVDGTIWNKI